MPVLDLDDLFGELVGRIETLTSRVDDLERLEHAMAQNHGWIGGAWQKDPLRLGYSGQILRVWSNTALSAGNVDVDDSAVPTGELWVITNFSASYTGTVTNVSLRFTIKSGASRYTIYHQGGLSSALYVDRQGLWILKAGDILSVRVLNATLNDDLNAEAIGYRVDIDQ